MDENEGGRGEELPGNSTGSMIGAIALGMVTAGLGSLFCVLLYKGYQSADVSRGWDQVPCVVEKSWVEPGRKTQDSPVHYRFRIEYRYSVGGKEYVGDKVKRVDGATSMQSKAEALLETYPEGLETVCFVNPKAPGEAILKHDTLAVGYTIWFPGLFVIGGIGIAVSGIRGWLWRRRVLAEKSAA